MHEICHGLGPAFARTAAGKVSIREAIGPQFSGLEEAKADVVGMFGLKWLIDNGAVPKEKLQEYYASYVGGMFRTVRFGTAEAHGQAEMMEFNYLSERGAIRRNATGRYAVDFEKMPGAVADLAKELLEIEATGDRAARGKLVQEIRADAGDVEGLAEDGVGCAGGCGSGVCVSGEGEVGRAVELRSAGPPTILFSGDKKSQAGPCVESQVSNTTRPGAPIGG